jgi:hypothetical protein
MTIAPTDTRDLALVDLVDRLIDGGVVLTGDLVLSVADVDLVYLGLRLVLAPARILSAQPSTGIPPQGSG